MNWGLISWVFGIMLTFAIIRFGFRLIRKIFSKETMDNAIGALGSGCTKSADNLSDYLASKIEARRVKKEAEKEENKPVITIR